MLSNDLCGLSLTTSSEASVKYYDDAIMNLACAQDPSKMLDQAIDEDPEFVLGHLLKGYIYMTYTDVDHIGSAKAHLDAINVLLHKNLSINTREKMHTQALSAWVEGDWRETQDILGELIEQYPHDTLALWVKSTLEVFLGDPGATCDTFSRAMPQWDKSHPLYSFPLAFYAFALEESREYEKAEKAGYLATELNPRVVWGIHSTAHALEMQGKVDEGSRFMDEYMDYWSKDNFFASHNAIHSILFKLEQGDMDSVVSLYDNFVFSEKTPPIIPPMIDASSALWRLHLENIDVGNRWNVLERSWQEKAGQSYYPFNDMHAMIALVGNGNDAAAAQLISRFESYLEDNSNAKMTGYAVMQDIGLPVCRAFYNFGQGNYNAVIDDLLPIQDQVYRLGGSHAQRDVVDRTLLEASLRAANKTVAEQQLSKRLQELPESPYNHKKMDQFKAILN